MEGYNGRCPVADDGVEIDESNDTPIMLFRLAQKTGTQIVDDNRKLHIYISAAECEALMNIYETPEEDRCEVMARMMLLQDVSNDMRPAKPAPPPSPKG